MAVVEDIETEPPKKSSKLPMILGLVLALAGGAGGFYAVQSGVLPGGGDKADKPVEKEEMVPLGDVAFVELPPMVISLGEVPGLRNLRFRASLETPSAYSAEVTRIMPRIIDVLNGYLRAVEVGELADRRALPKLRAQMLRRIQIVTGKGRVQDLLILEMVVN